jgi:hypothetical protein
VRGARRGRDERGRPIFGATAAEISRRSSRGRCAAQDSGSAEAAKRSLRRRFWAFGSRGIHVPPTSSCSAIRTTASKTIAGLDEPPVDESSSPSDLRNRRELADRERGSGTSHADATRSCAPATSRKTSTIASTSPNPPMSTRTLSSTAILTTRRFIGRSWRPLRRRDQPVMLHSTLIHPVGTRDKHVRVRLPVPTLPRKTWATPYERSRLISTSQRHPATAARAGDRSDRQTRSSRYHRRCNSDPEQNLKWQAIARYVSQLDCRTTGKDSLHPSCGYLRVFAKRVEFSGSSALPPERPTKVQVVSLAGGVS